MPGSAWLKLDEWKALAAKGEAPAASLRKGFVAEISQKDGETSRTLDFTISTGSVDRERDTIAPDGWKLAAFKKNPVVLWAHDYSMPPIARAKRIRIEDNALKATAEFVPAEVSPFAETVYQMLKGGFLRATSVGFRPMKYVFNAERGGVDFSQQELLEFSVVPVPANPDALLEGKAAGIDVEPLLAWAKAITARLSGPHDEDLEEDNPAPAPVRLLTSDDLRHGLAEFEAKFDARLEQFATRLVTVQEEGDAVLALTDDEPDDPDDAIELDADDVRAAFAGAFKDIVNAEVQGAINALRGRVD